MKHALCLLIACLAWVGISAQSLPRGLSDAEKQMIANGFFERPKTVPGAITWRSPNDPPRSMAEWEEMQAIVITWTQYRPILAEIVRHAVPEAKVLIVNRNEQSVRDYLSARGIDPDDNIEYINAEYNSIWVRDYGGNPAYLGDVDSLVLVDWIYNRPRPDDDLVPAAVAEHLGVPLLSTTEAPFDLVNTGGNYMSDGSGRAFSSKLVLDENGPQNIWGISNHDEEDVDAIMQQFLGIEEYVKMTVLPYDAIHHIDMHMKLVDEQTMVVGEYPEGIADGPQIEANLQYVLEQFKTATGQEYRVVRIPMPPDQFDRFPDQGGFYRTYANAMIVNRTVLVPTYELQYDTTALRIWQETMPGYEIVGIDCNSIIPASGALHCITKEVGVADPLWIRHFQPFEAMAGEATQITATVRHSSGIDQVVLYYKTSAMADYAEVDMTQAGAHDWVATLPGFEGGEEVRYYFRATAVSGKEVLRPLPAPAGYFQLKIEESTTSTTEVHHGSVDFRVFPNPARALTCVPVTVTAPTRAQLGIYDLHGRLISLLFDDEIQPGESRYFFDAGTIAAGIYVLELRTDNGRATRRLIIGQ